MKLLVLVSFGIIICACNNNSQNNSDENTNPNPAGQNSEKFSDDLSIEERNQIISERERRSEQKTETVEDRAENNAKILRRLKNEESREVPSKKKSALKNIKPGFSYAGFSKTEKDSVKSVLKDCSGSKDKVISVIINKQGKAFIPPDTKFKPALKKCLQSKLSGLSFFEGKPRKTTITIK